MAFFDLVSAMDAALLSTLSSGTVITIHPRSGSLDVQVPTLTKNPILEEDFMPGSQAGVSVLNLFGRADAAPATQTGDTATMNGVDYDVLNTGIDREGGMSIRLRRRNQPWNQR